MKLGDATGRLMGYAQVKHWGIKTAQEMDIFADGLLGEEPPVARRLQAAAKTWKGASRQARRDAMETAIEYNDDGKG